MKNLSNKNKALFIKTQDFDTAESMKNNGFKLVDHTDDTWTFVNDLDCPLTFDNNKITYSNMLIF